MDELSHAKRADGSLYFPTTGPNSLKYGGYQIVTTINAKAQAAAEKAASGKIKDTPMYGMKKGEGAALVSVQPGTGAVVAYYGGATARTSTSPASTATRSSATGT